METETWSNTRPSNRMIMALANLRVFKDEATQDRALVAIETDAGKPDERISPGSIPVRKGRYLDVDGVLARSLPQVASQIS
jgi:hypothetical protein